jgi:large conductance mechanosensitive channel protein
MAEKTTDGAKARSQRVKSVKILKVSTKQVTGFGDFLREYGVVGLAVGFVFGAQVKTVVDQLTQSFLNPVVGLILPGKGNLDQKTLTIHSLHKVTVFAWGSFVNTLISFIIIAAVIYFIVRFFGLDKFQKKVITTK